MTNTFGGAMELVLLMLPLGLVFAVAWLVYRAVLKRLRHDRRGEPSRLVSTPTLLSVPAGDPVDIRAPREYDRYFFVESRTVPGLRYRVNPFKMTCNCRGFRRHRRFHKPWRLGRCCHHLATVLVEVHNAGGTPLEAVLLEPGKGDWLVQLSTKLILGYSPASPWVDVYAPCSGKHPGGMVYGRFGYNVSTGDWSFNVRPADAGRLGLHLQEAFFGPAPESVEPPRSQAVGE